jgi:hypothetical protein
MSTTGNSNIEGIALRYGFFYGPGTWFHSDGDVAGQVRVLALTGQMPLSVQEFVRKNGAIFTVSTKAN